MDALDRLHRRLLEAVRRVRMETEDHSLTIADIYQHLVPYRLVRGELGFSELKEYEHALLRLLAGERDFLDVEMPQVAEEFRRELRSPNPILGIYRDYAAVSVSLSAAAPEETRAEAAVAAAPEAAPDEPPAAVEAPEPAVPEPAAAAAGVSLAGVTNPAPASPVTVPAASCWQCEEALPADRNVRFCPFCGTSQLRCLECGTTLEPQWRFCIQCGVAQPQLAER